MIMSDVDFKFHKRSAEERVTEYKDWFATPKVKSWQPVGWIDTSGIHRESGETLESFVERRRVFIHSTKRNER